MLLFLGTEQQYRLDAEGGGGERARKARVHVAQGLPDVTDGFGVQTHAAVLLGHVHGKEAHLAHPLVDFHGVLALLVNLRHDWGQLLVQHLADHLDQFLLFVGHQLILKH